MAIATIALGLLDVFMDFGTAQALIQRKDLDYDLVNSVFILNIFISIILAIGMLLASPLIARLSDLQSSTSVLQALSPSTIIVGACVAKRALLIRGMRFRLLAWTQVGGALAYAVASTLCAFWGWGVWSLVAGHYAHATATTLGIWGIHDWRPNQHFAWKDIRSIAHFGGNLAVYQVVSYLLRQAHKPLISRYLGPDALGLFSMTERIAILPSRTVALSLSGVMHSRFAKLQDNDDQLAQGFVRATAGLALVILPISMGLSLLAPSLVEVFFDKRWKGLDHLIIALAPSGAFFSFMFLCNSLYYSKLRTDVLLAWGMVHACLTLLANAVGIRYGIVAVGAFYSIAMALLSIPTFAIPLSLIHARLLIVLRALLPHCLAIVAMVPAALFPQWAFSALQWPPVLSLLASAFLAAAAFVGTILALKPPALYDLLRVARLKA